MSYLVRGLGEMQEFGRRVVQVNDPNVESYGVYFVNVEGAVDRVAEFVSLDDALLFVKIRERM